MGAAQRVELIAAEKAFNVVLLTSVLGLEVARGLVLLCCWLTLLIVTSWQQGLSIASAVPLRW